MTQRKRVLAQFTAILLSLFTLILTAPQDETPFALHGKYRKYSAYLSSPVAFNYLDRTGYYPESSEYRVALRLKERLKRRRIPSPSIPALAKAVKQRRELLKTKVNVEFLDMDDGELLNELVVSPQRYPTWIDPKFTLTKAQFTLNENSISSYFNAHPLDGITQPEDVALTGSAYSGSVLRAKTSGIAAPGYDIHYDEVASTLYDAMSYEQANLTIPLQWREGTITYDDGLETKTYKLLGSGRSNFRGSTWARQANVRKALREHVHNAIVQPGEEFSFVELLDAPVTTSKGWRMAKVIYNGSELRPAPGGGICQASTTVYRAIVNSGLPVLDRRYHSIYVSYYKKYGVGIDATVYPGSQDLVFKNDTGNPIIIQAQDTEDYDAIVSFYGVPDGRVVSLEGPYFRLNAPDDLKVNGREIWKNEIVWIQNVLYPDGNERRSQIVSRYKHLPQSIAREFIIREKDKLARADTH